MHGRLFLLFVAICALCAFDSVFGQHGPEYYKGSTGPYWQRSIVYQVYPRSLMDADGDGVGDLQGIRSKVPYLKNLGIEIVWLSPVLESPMVDFGYDVSNFTAIDPIFGTLQDFDDLLNTMHTEGLKLVMDFVPNHSSDKHDWFIRSEAGEDKYKDYYVWSDPRGYNGNGSPIPPNNWVSVFRYSAWQWSPKRKQFYLHQFVKEQPDLNYRNPAVKEEMKNAFRFWLDRGVDGFRIDAIKHMFEVEDMMGNDEPHALNSNTNDPTQYAYLEHTLTTNQPETYGVVREFRQVMDEYTDRIMMLEDYNDDISYTMKYYGTESEPLGDFPFNLDVVIELRSRSDVTGIKLKKVVDKWLDNMPKGKWPNWVLGNHDNGRVASRLGVDVVDALNMFYLLLPGTPITYNGEEIGMENTDIPFEQGVDPAGCKQGPEGYKKKSRDFNRTPMQWDATKNAGFSTAKRTWLPVNPNYRTLNVDNQEQAEQSHIKVYKALAQLRKTEPFTDGELKFIIVTNNTLAFVRRSPSQETYLVLINTSTESNTVDVAASSSADLPIPTTGLVKIRSSTDERPEMKAGSQISLSAVSLIGGEGVVFSL